MDLASGVYSPSRKFTRKLRPASSSCARKTSSPALKTASGVLAPQIYNDTLRDYKHLCAQFSQLRLAGILGSTR